MTVGGNRPIAADVRIIAATHKNLPDLIAERHFREDLYYRLNVVPIMLPALRQRGADIGMLARHFLEIAANEGLPRKQLDSDAVDRLRNHNWPGNVRELENLMRRLAVLSRHDVISASMIDQNLSDSRSPAEAVAVISSPTLSGTIEQHLAGYFAEFGSTLPPDGLYGRVLEEVERPLLIATMAAVRGNQLKAAKLLGINRNTLRKKLSDFRIDAQTGRSRF